MGRRDDLHTLLKATLGHNRAYFQPPEDVKMEYPCVKYERDRIMGTFADNIPYEHRTRYQLIYISRDVDDTMVQTLARLPRCSHERFYVANQLNHDVFTIFF